MHITGLNSNCMSNYQLHVLINNERRKKFREQSIEMKSYGYMSLSTPCCNFSFSFFVSSKNFEFLSSIDVCRVTMKSYMASAVCIAWRTTALYSVWPNYIALFEIIFSWIWLISFSELKRNCTDVKIHFSSLFAEEIIYISLVYLFVLWSLLD